jgi:DNA polymerase III epsilon subunit-like protein
MGMKIVIDTETGGLDPREHSLLTAAFVHLPSYEYHTFSVRPDLYRVTPKAMEINRLDLASLAITGKTPTACVEGLHEWLQGIAKKHEGLDGQDRIQVTPIGHNVRFDRDFLERLYLDTCPPGVTIGDRQDLFDNIWSYRCLDACGTARILMEAGRLRDLKSASLDALIKYFRVAPPTPSPETGRHTALGDALATAKVYEHLMHMLKGAPEGPREEIAETFRRKISPLERYFDDCKCEGYPCPHKGRVAG